MEYKRILLKLSGEILAGDKRFGFDHLSLKHYVEEIKKVYQAGVQVAVIVGAGNIWRGIQGSKLAIDAVKADHMGMLATMINSVALQSMLAKEGIPVCLMSRLNMTRICEGYSATKAVCHLEKGRVVIVGGGTSNPCFTTDSAAALTAIEVGADVFVKGTKVDGVYAQDPVVNPEATFYGSLSLKKALKEGLAVMDMTAMRLCIDNALSAIVYNATKKNQLLKVLIQKKGGTFLHV